MAVGILLRLLMMARSAADEPKPLHALRDANSCPPQLDFGAAAPAATLLPPATAAPLGCDDCCYELLPEHFAAVAGYQNRPTPYKSKTPPIVCGSSVSPRSPALPAADCWFPALEPCEHFVFAIKQGDELRTPNADCETAQKRWLTAMSGPWQSALGWPTKWPTVSLGGPATWDGKAGSAHLVIVMTRKGWLLAGRKDIGGFGWVEEERCTRGVDAVGHEVLAPLAPRVHPDPGDGYLLAAHRSASCPSSTTGFQRQIVRSWRDPSSAASS